MGQQGLIEVIVIDDGSTDGTEAAVSEMLKKDLTTESTESTIERQGRCEMEQPKVGPKGEEAGASESKGEAGLTTDFTDGHGYSAGLRPGSRAGAAFSNSSPSELKQDSENTSLIRSADGLASLPATSYSLPVTADLPVLRLIRHEVSAGYIVRRNEGAWVAVGDVIFSMDDDAVFSSPFVVEQTLRDFSHPRIGAVAIPYIEPHKTNKEMQRAPTREDVWITASYIGTAHAVRRDVFLALGGYRECLVHQGEEGDFCIRMLAAKHEREAGLTTDDTNGHGYSAGLRPGSQPGTEFSNPSTCKLARDSENTSLTCSANVPALERIASGWAGSGGGNQLADSGEFSEGQSQAGLHMDSHKHPNPCAAMGSTTSWDYSSSVPIREIRGKKNSGVQEALDASLPATSYLPPATPLEAAVPGFFVRLGNSDLIIHNESPKREYSRMDFYGRRNDVLFHWQNTPMPDLLWQLPMTIAGGLLCAYRVKRWRKMLEGIGAGFLAIAGGVERKPVSKSIVALHKNLKSSPHNL
jgi:glycosyltransferase involved in cell wall biosynthesis